MTQAAVKDDAQEKALAAHEKNIAATAANGVQCQLDGVWVHSVPTYLARVWPDVTVAQYQEQFPNAPLVSPAVEAARLAKASSVKINNATVFQMPNAAPASKPTKKSFSDVFELGAAAAAKNARGEAIMIEVLGNPEPQFSDYIPDKDNGYVFNIDLLKTVMIAVTMNKTLLLWGMHGTGKTTVLEQYCSRTNRPFMRVQHTATTEEAHVLGQYVVKDGSTHFEPGPLAIAMRFGLVYCADEYDFALPNVVAVYQPVMEGKRLFIKEASPEWRVVVPHPNFRFVATGNTNGAGDNTGLYQGTQLQNAANYSRFALTAKVNYMDKAHEVAVIMSQGGLAQPDAEHLREFAEMVRLAYEKAEIGIPISPRELINAAQISRACGGKFRQALGLAFMNRLNDTDRLVCDNAAQRIFSD